MFDTAIALLTAAVGACGLVDKNSTNLFDAGLESGRESIKGVNSSAPNIATTMWPVVAFDSSDARFIRLLILIPVVNIKVHLIHQLGTITTVGGVSLLFLLLNEKLQASFCWRS